MKSELALVAEEVRSHLPEINLCSWAVMRKSSLSCAKHPRTEPARVHASRKVPQGAGGRREQTMRRRAEVP